MQIPRLYHVKYTVYRPDSKDVITQGQIPVVRDYENLAKRSAKIRLQELLPFPCDVVIHADPAVSESIG